MQAALQENREVFEFLRSASAKLVSASGSRGPGIIHQVVLENYAFPGGLMINHIDRSRAGDRGCPAI